MASRSTPNRARTMEILSRFRSAKTDRERRKVADSVKKEFPHIAENLNKLIEEGGIGATKI